MGIFNDFLENAKAVVYKVGEKASDAYDITKLNTIKARHERDLAKQYKALGVKYYGAFKSNELEKTDFSKELSEIEDLIEQLDNTKKQIDNIKNMKRCPVCSKLIKADETYCSECGSKL